MPFQTFTIPAFALGILTTPAADKIPPGAFADCRNVELDETGTAKTRAGYAKHPSDMSALNSGAEIDHMYVPAILYGTILNCIAGDRVYSRMYGGWFEIDNGVTVTDSDYWVSARFGSKTIFCCRDNSQQLVQTDGFSSIGAISGAPYGVFALASHLNYLFAGNLYEGGTTYSNRLRISAVGDHTTWPATSFVDVDPNDRDFITALAEWQGNLYVFKNNSTHVVTGMNPATWQVRCILPDNGCLGQQTMQVTERGILLADHDGVKLFDGVKMNPVSPGIRDLIRTINPTKFRCSAINRGKHQYWLAFDSGVLVYDYVDGWWTRYDFVPTAMVGRTRYDYVGGSSLYEDLVYFGDTNGYTYKACTGTNDDGAAIDAWFETGDLDFEAPHVFKDYRRIRVYSAPKSNDLDVYYRVNGDSSYTADSITSMAGGSVLPNEQRLNIFKQGNYLRLKFGNNDADESFGVRGIGVDWVPRRVFR